MCFLVQSNALDFLTNLFSSTIITVNDKISLCLIQKLILKIYLSCILHDTLKVSQLTFNLCDCLKSDRDHRINTSTFTHSGREYNYVTPIPKRFSDSDRIELHLTELISNATLPPRSVARSCHLITNSAKSVIL